MIVAPIHSYEKMRIQALLDCGLLDTPEEADFDRMTSLASHICQTPIALISLIDEDRQWFKSRVGLDPQETPRDYAFCSHAILKDGIFVIEDSRNDQRFFDNPLVKDDPRVIFYAGVPLLDPQSSLPLGTICVIDHEPRSLSEAQIKALCDLSAQVSKLIDLRQRIVQMELRNKELKQIATAIENMQEGFVLHDKDGSITDFNSSALTILGLEREQILGRKSTDPSWSCLRADGSEFPGQEHPAMVALRTGEAQTGVKMRVRSTHLKERWISVNASPIFLPQESEPSSVVVTFSDNTDLELTQEKLVETARLASLAEMAAGVAHEINNPLAIISAFTSASLKICGEESIDREALQRNQKKIQDTVFRISKIVKGLRSLSRDGSHEPNVRLSVTDVISEALSVCSEKFQHQAIKIENRVETNLFAFGNYVKLGQVFLNLFSNSFDAVSDKEDRWLKISSEESSELIRILVSDSGGGVPAEILQKIFLPFFTTKEVGKGTGLGLSISKSFMEQMGGSLTYDKHATHTTFVLELRSAASEP